MQTDNTISFNFRKEYIGEHTIIEDINKIFLLLEKLWLPHPILIDIVDKKPKTLHGYFDPIIADTINSEIKRKQMPLVLESANSQFVISFSTDPRRFSFSLKINSILKPESHIVELKELFKSICILLNPYMATIEPSFHREILDKHFEWDRRTSYFTLFSWLQYFGPEEFRKQGGDAIFENPYIKAEKLGEGVLIQVGESPFDAATPEGEELIVKATRALPPVVK